MTTPTPDVDPALVELARDWHHWSDHAQDGTPFGGGLCNCLAQAKRVRRVLEPHIQQRANKLDAEVWWDRGRKFGQACVTGTRITTDAIAESVREVGVNETADLFSITPEQVEGAVAYEDHIQQRVRDALENAARDLRQIAADRMDTHGPSDQRGAAIWDTAAWLDKAKP